MIVSSNDAGGNARRPRRCRQDGTFDDPARFVPDSEVKCIAALPRVTDGNARVRYDRTGFDLIDNPKR